MGASPLNSVRLADTSSSTASGNSSATLGVNCPHQAASASSASVSPATSRDFTRSRGAMAVAAATLMPGRTPRASAFLSQAAM